MSVDVSHIVKNDYYDLENRSQTEAFMRETVDSLKKFFCFNTGIDLKITKYDEDDETPEYSIDLKLFNTEITLRHGFWEVETYFHYSQFFHRIDDCLWLRDTLCDITRALGQNEGWTCDEFHSWNCADFEIEKVTFEEWHNRWGDITEFDQGITRDWDEAAIDYDQIYHDSYEDCFQRLRSFELQFPEYRIIGIRCIGEAFLLSEKHGKLSLLNKDSQTPLIIDNIDSIVTYSTWFAASRNGQSALFDSKGKQMTPFGNHDFDWKRRSTDDNCILFDKNSDLIFDILK